MEQKSNEINDLLYFTKYQITIEEDMRIGLIQLKINT